MTLNITQDEINTLWEKGYRPWEIYTCNETPVKYFGELKQAGEISGWDIKHIFATREAIKTYPFFDCIIMMDCVAYCTEIWE